MTDKTLEDRKEIASAWFAELRDRMCAAFEKLEDEVQPPNDAAGEDGKP